MMYFWQDPYVNDPSRHPALKINTKKPFNAEPPMQLLADNFVTPNDIFFIRNHLPVPDIDANTYELEITGEGVKTIKLSLEVGEVALLMSRGWDKEKIWVPDRIWTYDLPNTQQALYPPDLRRAHGVRGHNYARFIFEMCPAYC